MGGGSHFVEVTVPTGSTKLLGFIDTKGGLAARVRIADLVANW